MSKLNDMKADASLVKPKRGADQQDTGLAAEGMMGDGVNRSRATERFAGNQTGLMMRERYGRGPLTGNASDSGIERDIGPSATRDKQRLTIATASQGVNIGKGFRCPPVGNADKINIK